MSLEIDNFLRSEGWRIYSRPRQGEAVWIRRGVKLTQEKAVAVSRREYYKLRPPGEKAKKP